MVEDSQELIERLSTNEPSPQNQKDFKDVKLWLLKVDCPQYASKFIEHGITYDLIPELDTEALKDIGVDKIGDRIKLEMGVSELKAETFREKVSVDDLYQLMNLSLSQQFSPKIDINHMNAILSSEGGSQIIESLGGTGIGSSQQILGSQKESNKNITFILQDGSTKKVNVTGCFNAQSIKRKGLRKLGVKHPESEFDTYVHSSSNSNAATPNLNSLYDVELVTICYSPDRTEKNRIILCLNSEVPSQAAIDTSLKIISKYEKFTSQELAANNLRHNLSQYHIPDTRKNMRNFFGQRPPSELISSNLAEYFPETHQKDLKATVRNSLRYSVLMSRKNNVALLPVSSGSSSSSVSKRHSEYVAGLGPYSRSSVISSDIFSTRRLPSATIGGMMVNNINAIDEAVNPGDQHSLSSKEPSLHSSSNLSNADAKSIASSIVKPNTMNHRVSIATSFSDNRHSRIELFNIESDSDEDFIDGYGTLMEETNEAVDESLTSISEEGPRNWLKGARIGAGSFGEVYLGMNPLTGELMAVKQVALPDHKRITPSQRAVIEALQREMSLLKELNHENIVRYYGASTDDSFLNIFLEYVPGGSVQSMLTSYGPFEEPLIRNFIRQVLIGLNYLHGEDIIHRDIKGANILIDIKGTVKISDFGISKKVGDNIDGEKKGRRASLQGSVYWMAPEVVKQTTYTKKADIWSVGCLIVEMFTGKHPFPDFSQMQAIFKIGTHISPKIPEWCTEEAKSFLSRAFELDYNNRPDAVEMLADSFLNPLIMSKK